MCNFLVYFDNIGISCKNSWLMEEDDTIVSLLAAFTLYVHGACRKFFQEET